MIIRGRELISALSINISFNNGCVQREPAISQTLHVYCMCVCSPLSILVF